MLINKTECIKKSVFCEFRIIKTNHEKKICIYRNKKFFFLVLKSINDRFKYRS